MFLNSSGANSNRLEKETKFIDIYYKILYNSNLIKNIK